MNNFVIGDTVELKFKLNISGTSAIPSLVHVVLGIDPSVHYLAKQNIDTQEWSALVTPVKDIHAAGSSQLSIEVVLAGKLHTVVKREIFIGDVPAINAEFVTPVAPVEPQVEPVQIPQVTPEYNTPTIVPTDDVKAVETVVDLTNVEQKKKENVDEIISQPVITKKIIPEAIIPTAPKQVKKIELDFKSIVSESEKKSPVKKKTVAPPKEKQITVNEITTQKTLFTLRKGKIITK